MSSFKNTFQLSVQDIELIEKALRNEISHLTGQIHLPDEPAPQATGMMKACDENIRMIHQVLGKLHNQKIWYGQVNSTGVPISG
jgi:hypothetical protein